jgi:hypothetical protein
MTKAKTSKTAVVVATFALWILAAWLLYPLVNLDGVDMSNVQSYIYRSALGLTLLIIFFGKTLFDLIFPWVQGRKLPALNAALLSLYAVALAGGILFAVLRLVTVFLRSRKQGFVF